MSNTLSRDVTSPLLNPFNSKIEFSINVIIKSLFISVGDSFDMTNSNNKKRHNQQLNQLISQSLRISQPEFIYLEIYVSE